MFTLGKHHSLPPPALGISLKAFPLMQPTPDTALPTLLAYLEAEYYTKLESLCERAEYHLADLSKDDEPGGESLYNSLSKKLIGQVGQYVRLRRFGLAPYIQELVRKEDIGHDCRSCSDSCVTRHRAQITGIKEGHNRIKEALYRLQSIAPPMYSAPQQDNVYRSLRADLMQLDTALTELFYLEESSLIPKVMEAQKAIHAHS
jgi:hypothetical protein